MGITSRLPVIRKESAGPRWQYAPGNPLIPARAFESACRRGRHLHAKRSGKGWRNVLLPGRSRVRSRSYRGACKHQRNRYVIRPRRTVHIRHVSPRDEVAFARNNQELAGSSRKVCPSKHFQKALSRRKGVCIGWCCMLDPRRFRSRLATIQKSSGSSRTRRRVQTLF
jgi:hypothetical protein